MQNFFAKVDNERIYIRIESRSTFGNGTAHFAISEWKGLLGALVT